MQPYVQRIAAGLSPFLNQVESIFNSERESAMQAIVEKVTIVTLGLSFAAYDTLSTAIGIGAAAAFYMTARHLYTKKDETNSEELKSIYGQVKRLWANQNFRELALVTFFSGMAICATWLNPIASVMAGGGTAAYFIYQFMPPISTPDNDTAS